jgi:type IV secretion system protein VirB10
MDEPSTNNTLTAAAETSQVTPRKNKQSIKQKAQLGLFGLIAVVVLTTAFMPHKAKEAQRESHDSQSSRETLNQNLELINTLKEPKPLRVALEPEREVSEEAFVDERTEEEKLSKAMRLRMNAASSFGIGGTTSDALSTSSDTSSINTNLQAQQGKDPDQAFLSQNDDITIVSARKLAHPEFTVPAGEMISATLETAINSDLPGMVRAIVTRDIYSLKNGNRLISRGATLVGQFNSQVIEGQDRVLIIWNRIHMSNGVIVTLNSPGADRIGRSGQGADFVDTHFIERFRSSALLSLLGVFTATVGVSDSRDRYNSASQYRAALANNFQNASGQSLQANSAMKPTIHINQGADINVFVSHDLDFKNVGVATNHGPEVIRGDVWK